MKKSELKKLIKEIFQSENDGIDRMYGFGVYQIMKSPKSISQKGMRQFGDGSVGRLIHTSPTVEAAKKFAKERRQVRTEGEKAFHKITYRVAKLGNKHKTGAK